MLFGERLSVPDGVPVVEIECDAVVLSGEVWEALELLDDETLGVALELLVIHNDIVTDEEEEGDIVSLSVSHSTSRRHPT
jgi:hypothetical protein